MKKQGVIILENLLAFVLIMVIMGGIFLGVDQLKMFIVNMNIISLKCNF